MKVLVACEYSGTVRDAFTKAGHYAMSCDILPTESEGPHYQGDVLDVLNDGWDLMIAHPPCTYLSFAGQRWLTPNGILNEERYYKGLEAKEFFMKLYNAPIPKICIENPIPSSIYKLPKETQRIQPYEHGHEAQKTTLLWLKGLKPLKPTNVVGKGEFTVYASGKKLPTWFAKHWGDGKARSLFWQGIADAMANQWGQ